jgi:hypothetical protein
MINEYVGKDLEWSQSQMLFKYFRGKNQEKHKNPQYIRCLGQGSNRYPPEIKLEALRPEWTCPVAREHSGPEFQLLLLVVLRISKFHLSAVTGSIFIQEIYQDR